MAEPSADIQTDQSASCDRGVSRVELDGAGPSRTDRISSLFQIDVRHDLPPVEPLAPHEIKHIRESARVSQAVFARLLNTSVSTVQKWEIGQKKPTGTALLHLVQKRGLDVVPKLNQTTKQD